MLEISILGSRVMNCCLYPHATPLSVMLFLIYLYVHAGGSAHLANEFMSRSGITDDTCAPYAAMSPTQWGEVDCVNTMCR